jgi:hypothetical protein
VGRRLRPGVHQGLQLLPLPDQGLGQRPRVGQAPSRQGPGWPSPSCPTGLGPAPTRSGSRRSATGSGPPPSTPSCSAGLLVCRCRWARRTGMAATGGSARCARSRFPAPSCSTRPGTPEASSRRSSPTTSTLVGPPTWRSSSAARSAATPRGCFGPRSTAATTRAWSSTSSTSTRGSSSTSKTAGRCASRPWSTPPATWAATPGCPTSTNCRHAPVHATAASWMLNVSARLCACESSL